MVTLLSREINTILVQRDLAAKFTQMGLVPVGSTPEQFADMIARDIATWTRVVKGRGSVSTDPFSAIATDGATARLAANALMRSLPPRRAHEGGFRIAGAVKQRDADDHARILVDSGISTADLPQH